MCIAGLLLIAYGLYDTACRQRTFAWGRMCMAGLALIADGPLAGHAGGKPSHWRDAEARARQGLPCMPTADGADHHRSSKKAGKTSLHKPRHSGKHVHFDGAEAGPSANSQEVRVLDCHHLLDQGPLSWPMYSALCYCNALL